MGIQLAIFSGLAELSGRFRPTGRSLMLGRQRLRRETRGWRDRLTGSGHQRALRQFRPDVDLAQCFQPDGYAETMFRALGFGEVESLDFSEFEGATLLWDLNRPVPEDWHGQFGFIFDGGTIEHVFDVPQALRNVFVMLAPGGRFVGVSPMNGWIGHGLYQFNPELVWSFWKRACGCTVHRCQAVTRDGGFRLDMPDVAIDGRRRPFRTGRFLRGGFPLGHVLLWSEVEKTPEARLGGVAMQGDYVARWDEAGKPTAARPAMKGASE